MWIQTLQVCALNTGQGSMMTVNLNQNETNKKLAMEFILVECRTAESETEC